MGSQEDPRLTPADLEIIKRKAKALVGHFGYRAGDVEDLVQDVAAHVFQQTHRHRPERGSREKFVSTIAKNKLLHLIEHRTAKKRDTRRDVSIGDRAEGTPFESGGTPDRIDAGIDVRKAIARLPEELRQVALLRQWHNEKEIEALLNLTRAKVRSRLQRIERIFREAGFAPDSDE